MSPGWDQASPKWDGRVRQNGGKGVMLAYSGVARYVLWQ